MMYSFYNNLHTPVRSLF